MGKRKVWEKLLSSERLGAGKAPGTAERTAFQQDYDRIVFTSAFRRMKDKTQVFPLSKSDYVRTRLTHSLEVSCVGRSLGAVVGREIIARHGLQHVESGDFGAIVAAACLAHDIGNPPFGHAGEDAIREWFRHSGLLDRHDFTPAQKADFERYEGNAQGFRIVSRLQSPANPGGLQLSSAVTAQGSGAIGPGVRRPKGFHGGNSVQGPNLGACRAVHSHGQRKQHWQEIQKRPVRSHRIPGDRRFSGHFMVPQDRETATTTGLTQALTLTSADQITCLLDGSRSFPDVPRSRGSKAWEPRLFRHPALTVPFQMSPPA